MKHLAIVTDAWSPQVNGVVTTMKVMVEEAEARGWTVTVIHPGMFKTIPLPGYPEIKVVVNPWKLGSLLPETVNSIHIVTEGPLGWAARILCAARNWEFTTGFHTNFPEYLKLSAKIPLWLTYPIFRWFHQRAKAVFVPSKSTQTKLLARGFRRLVIWSRGYRPDIFNPTRRRTDLLTPSKINLVYVGRVSLEKNIEAFLALRRNPDYVLWVVGDGPDRARLEALGGATFVGFKHGVELAEYFASADVFVFPSKTDTLGIVSIEAMACGTPVAAFDVEGPRDVVQTGLGGWLSNNLELAVKCALLLNNRELVLENARIHTWSVAADTFYNNLVHLQTGERF